MTKINLYTLYTFFYNTLFTTGKTKNITKLGESMQKNVSYEHQFSGRESVDRDLREISSEEWETLPENEKRWLVLKKVHRILRENNTMYIATASQSNPSVNSMFYAYDINEEDGSFVIYAFTLLAGKAMQMWVNPKVSIQINAKNAGEVKEDGTIDLVEGVQIKGRAEFVSDPKEIEHIRAKITEASKGLFAKYYSLPIARWVKIIPTEVKYIDFFSPKIFYFVEFRKNQPSFFKNLYTSTKKTLLLWALTIRAPFFTATIAPLFLGAAIAAVHLHNKGLQFNWFLFILTVLAGILIHAGVNVSNDYFDHWTRNDEVNPIPTPVNGGSRTIQAGLMSSTKVGLVGILFFIAGSLIALYINLASDGLVLPGLLLIGVFLGFFYTAPPLKLAYRGLGELAVAIGFGPLFVLAAYYIQTHQLSLEPIIVSTPIAILIMLVLFINEFPDYYADKKVGKNTWVVRLGRKKAFKLYKILIYATYAAIVVLSIYNLWLLITLLTLPIALKAIKVAEENLQDPIEMLPANFGTIKTHFAVGMLMTLAYILAFFIPLAPITLLF